MSIKDRGGYKKTRTVHCVRGIIGEKGVKARSNERGERGDDERGKGRGRGNAEVSREQRAKGKRTSATFRIGLDIPVFRWSPFPASPLQIPGLFTDVRRNEISLARPLLSGRRDAMRRDARVTGVIFHSDTATRPGQSMAHSLSRTPTELRHSDSRRKMLHPGNRFQKRAASF